MSRCLYTNDRQMSRIPDPDTIAGYFWDHGCQVQKEFKKREQKQRRHERDLERQRLRREQLEWEAFDRSKAPPLKLPPPPPSFHILHVPLFRLPPLRRASKDTGGDDAAQ